MAIRYFSVADALDLYEDIMLRTGGTPQPIRSLDALASALNRAQTAGYYGGADLIGQAARLAVGLSRAQAYLDGNKRLGMFAMLAFLNLNGVRLVVNSLEGAQLLDRLADPAVADDTADAEFEAWLRAHTARGE